MAILEFFFFFAHCIDYSSKLLWLQFNLWSILQFLVIQRFRFFFNAILPCVPIQKHQYVNKGKVAAASEEQSMDSRRQLLPSLKIRKSIPLMCITNTLLANYLAMYYYNNVVQYQTNTATIWQWIYLQVYPTERHSLRHMDVSEHFETTLICFLSDHL